MMIPPGYPSGSPRHGRGGLSIDTVGRPSSSSMQAGSSYYERPSSRGDIRTPQHDALRRNLGQLRGEYGWDGYDEGGMSSPLCGSPMHSPSGKFSSLMHEASASPPASPVSRGGMLHYGPAPPMSPGNMSNSSLHAPPLSPSHAIMGSPGDSNLLENHNFVEWLFLGLGGHDSDPSRINMLEVMLAECLETGAGAANLVLTNGFALDATKALQQAGLAQYFHAVCDTRGSIVFEPAEPGAKAAPVELGGGGRYSKRNFISDVLLRNARALDLATPSYGVYVDDDPEPLSGTTIVTHRLPREGNGITPEDAKQIVAMGKDQATRNGGTGVFIFDFDCTLSRRHMFKAMHQPGSTWARDWDSYAASNELQRGRRGDSVIMEKPF